MNDFMRGYFTACGVYVFWAIVISLLTSCGPNVGRPGLQGPPGERGESGFEQIVEVLADAPTCLSGGKTLLFALDADRNGFISVMDRHLRSAEVCNGSAGVPGAPGEDGADGTSPIGMTLIDVIDPCGDAPGVVDEVLLQLSDGRILASFSQNASGLNTRFSIIGVGSYVTTDGSACHFSVDVDNNVGF